MSIKPQYHDELKILGDFIRDFPNAKGEISGHTDNVGDKQFNVDLSAARAQAVKDYLVKQGVDATRLDTKGYGDAKPIAANGSEAGRQKNRRVQFMLVEAK